MANLGMPPTSPLDFMQGLYGGVQNFLGGMGGGMHQTAQPPPPAPGAPPAGGYGGTGQYNGMAPGAATPGGGVSYGPQMPGARSSGYGGMGAGGAAAGAAGAAGGMGSPAANAQVSMNPNADITDPTGAVLASIMQMGINPLAGGPWVKAVLSHAADLMNSLKAQAALNPTGDILSNPDHLSAAVSNIVRQALGGQNVLFTGGAGAGMADVLRSVMGGVTPGGANNTADQNILAQQMQDPATSANLLNSLLYGGTTAPFRAAASDWTKLLPTILANYQWQNPGQFPSAAPGAPASAPTILDLLPQLRNFRYNPATSGQGVSLPPGQ